MYTFSLKMYTFSKFYNIIPTNLSNQNTRVLIIFLLKNDNNYNYNKI